MTVDEARELFDNADSLETLVGRREKFDSLKESECDPVEFGIVIKTDEYQLLRNTLDELIENRVYRIKQILGVDIDEH